jgi:hypothetical protein
MSADAIQIRKRGFEPRDDNEMGNIWQGLPLWPEEGRRGALGGEGRLGGGGALGGGDQNLGPDRYGWPRHQTHFALQTLVAMGIL